MVSDLDKLGSRTQYTAGKTKSWQRELVLLKTSTLEPSENHKYSHTGEWGQR